MKRIVLLPGQLYVGRDVDQISTILGSCVSVILWYPKKKIVTMCHYVLPGKSEQYLKQKNCRYAIDALDTMLDGIRKYGAQLQEYKVCVRWRRVHQDM
jgi:chemotaxis protein CheD